MGGSAQWGQEASPRAQGPPFAWSLSSWLADFFQSSMRSCSGLMRLSSSALWVGCEGQGHQGKVSLRTPARPPATPTHLVNCRSLVSMLRWRMHMRVSAEPMSRVAPGEASAAWEGARRGLCSPSLGHEVACQPAKAELASRAPPPALRDPAMGDLIGPQYLRPSSLREQGPAYAGRIRLLQLWVFWWSGQR